MGSWGEVEEGRVRAGSCGQRGDASGGSLGGFRGCHRSLEGAKWQLDRWEACRPGSEAGERQSEGLSCWVT